MCSDSQSPADTRPMAEASEAAARIGAEQGDRVLDESKRQYDLNRATIDPIVKAQAGLMKQSITQGNDYYEFMKSTYRPIEESLAMDVNLTPEQAAAKQEEAAGKAMADSQGGYTRAIGQAIRQGKRYGVDAPAVTGEMAVQQAATTAGAANAARTAEEVKQYARKVDLTGIGKGLVGASTGAYSMANASGNSAAGNQMAPGAQMVSGTTQAAGLTMQGQSARLGGLGKVADLQNQAYQSEQQGNAATMAGLGQLAMGGAMLYKSSGELKENKEPVDGGSALDSIRKLPVEKWDYKEGVADEGEHIGPYAEDVQEEFGDQAAPGGQMLDMVTMNGILMKSVQELADRVDALGGKAAKKPRGESVALPRKAPMARSGTGEY